MRHSDDSDPVRALREAVARSLARHVRPGEPVAIALSGGRDSVVLLDALLHTDAVPGLVALHVHHGLSTHADAWQRFCASLCAARGVVLAVRAVTVPRAPQSSLEGEARRQRYAALATAAIANGIRVVALAHHRDDQAETLLLQLLRGSGPHGLAGMPAVRTDPRGIAWLRPLLEVRRSSIDAYAQAAGLAFVDDDSNTNARHRRNAVRQVVMPALATVFPDPVATLARAAAHQADAARLADDLAALDSDAASDGATLDRAVLAALPAHRARNLLRWFLRQRGLAAPSTARLSAMLDQLTRARGDADVRLLHEGVELGIHGGRIHLHAPAPPAFDVRWHGERELALPHGTLVFERVEGAGADVARLSAEPVHVRPRSGGERLQLAANRPRRALKAILQDAGMPVWERVALPLVYCGDALAAAPGIGVDAGFITAPGHAGVAIAWHPACV